MNLRDCKKARCGWGQQQGEELIWTRYRGTTCGTVPELNLLFKVGCKITGEFLGDK